MGSSITTAGLNADLDRTYPASVNYSALYPPPVETVREGGHRPHRPAFTERHLQCAWFDPAWRPRALTSSRGETVVVEDPGIWNLEAGPDFLGAVLRVGREQRRITGDVEIHIRAGDWKQHGHYRDARYLRVRAHVTYFPGLVPDDLLPPGAIQIALQPALAAQPSFSFDSIDVAAYPYAERATVPPCREELRRWNTWQRAALLDAAGQERLRRKAGRLAQAMAEKGEEQILYEEVMTALGYKHNKAPFRQLAQRVPVAELQAAARGKAEPAFALLAGLSGLLPERVRRGWDSETRQYVRARWDEWWKLKEPWTPNLMSRADWRLANLRPANHPLRRIMAAACLFSRPDTVGALLSPPPATGAVAWMAQTSALFAQVSAPYWDRRYTFSSAKLKAPLGLIGPARAQAILINVLVPGLAARGVPAAFLTEVLGKLPADDDNAVVRQTAANLFGPDHSEQAYRNGLRRQGLIQVFHDYCLNDRSRCAACPFPDRLRAHRQSFTSGSDPAG